jgi:hypothetical protein
VHDEAIARGGCVDPSDYRDGFDRAGSFQDEHLRLRTGTGATRAGDAQRRSAAS